MGGRHGGRTARSHRVLGRADGQGRKRLPAPVGKHHLGLGPGGENQRRPAGAGLVCDEAPARNLYGRRAGSDNRGFAVVGNECDILDPDEVAPRCRHRAPSGWMARLLVLYREHPPTVGNEVEHAVCAAQRAAEGRLAGERDLDRRQGIPLPIEHAATQHDDAPRFEDRGHSGLDRVDAAVEKSGGRGDVRRDRRVKRWRHGGRIGGQRGSGFADHSQRARRGIAGAIRRGEGERIAAIVQRHRCGKGQVRRNRNFLPIDRQIGRFGKSAADRDLRLSDASAVGRRAEADLRRYRVDRKRDLGRLGAVAGEIVDGRRERRWPLIQVPGGTAACAILPKRAANRQRRAVSLDRERRWIESRTRIAEPQLDQRPPSSQVCAGQRPGNLNLGREEIRVKRQVSNMVRRPKRRHVRDFPSTAHSRNAIVDGNPGGAIAWIGDQLDDLGTAVEGPNPEDRLAGAVEPRQLLAGRDPGATVWRGGDMKKISALGFKQKIPLRSIPPQRSLLCHPHAAIRSRIKITQPFGGEAVYESRSDCVIGCRRSACSNPQRLLPQIDRQGLRLTFQVDGMERLARRGEAAQLRANRQPDRAVLWNRDQLGVFRSRERHRS